MNPMANGRERLGWSEPVWQHVDQAVHDEAVRAEIASKFIPLRGPFPDALTVPADVIDTEAMAIEEGLVKPLIELWVDFALTPQQVAGEERLATAMTLATRASNLLSRAEDVLIFQGDGALTSEFFTRVRYRSGPVGPGLLNSATQAIEVDPLEGATKKYGEKTFEAVARAYSLLQRVGHNGPYALVLHSEVYADTYAPLASTLVMPADRIRPLVTQGFYGTGTLPESTGLLVSLGGNTMDVVVGIDPTTAFQQMDDSGIYRFRVFERFALRIKDPSSIVRLHFK
jgi:uncharacterized linocin/CFP29 family protein